MGQIQDTCLQFESAVDQYVGHITVSGLPICSPNFALLLSQFDCHLKDTKEFVKIVFPSLLSGLMIAGRFLSARLLFHLDFLQNSLSPSHHLMG